MEIQTENAYMIVDQQIESGCVLPINCLKEVFSIYVADNIDRKEETVSGIANLQRYSNSFFFEKTFNPAIRIFVFCRYVT